MTLAKALQYVSKTFHGLYKSPFALLLPPIFQILCDICLKYFMIPAKALRHMSKKFHDSCKSLLALPPPSPLLQKLFNICPKYFMTPAKTLHCSSTLSSKSLLRYVYNISSPLQKPSDIHLKYFMTPAKALRPPFALLSQKPSDICL